MGEGFMRLVKSIEKNQQPIQLKLSTIFKQKVSDTPQAFGHFYDSNAGKYCAVSVLLKYLGYDIAALTDKKQSGDNTDLAALIPNAILEMIENFTEYSRSKYVKCLCSKPDYYYRHSLISLLIHLNDYHNMTFTQIGNWLESKDL